MTDGRQKIRFKKTYLVLILKKNRFETKFEHSCVVAPNFSVDSHDISSFIAGQRNIQYSFSSRVVASTTSYSRARTRITIGVHTRTRTFNEFFLFSFFSLFSPCGQKGLWLDTVYYKIIIILYYYIIAMHTPVSSVESLFPNKNGITVPFRLEF